MIVQIDVDGVIRDVISAMCKVYNEKFDGCLCVDDIDDYDVNTNFPKIIEETGRKPTEYFFTDHADKIFETVSKPFDGVKEGIDLLRKYGHKVVIVTWQFSLKNIKHTLDFLDMYYKLSEINFTNMPLLLLSYIGSPELGVHEKDFREPKFLDVNYDELPPQYNAPIKSNNPFSSIDGDARTSKPNKKINW